MLSTAGLVALVYGFTEAAKPDVGWDAPSTLGILGAGRRAAGRVRGLGVAGRATRCCRCASRSTATAAGRTSIFLLVGAGLFAMFLFLTYYFQVDAGLQPR